MTWPNQAEAIETLNRLEAQRDRIDTEWQRVRSRRRSVTDRRSRTPARGIEAARLRDQIAELEERFERVDSASVREVCDGSPTYSHCFIERSWQ